MIRFEHVSCGYGKGEQALCDVSFTIRDGEQVGLLGANGAGKSTLMKAMLGLLPVEGKIYIDELAVCPDNLPEVRRRLGYVLQDSDNQMFMPTVYEDMIFGPLNYGKSREEAEKQAERALGELGLLHLKHRPNYRMSGGEKRLAAIATILAMEPEVMLMDEPSTALDPANRRRLIQILKKLPVTKLIATHDLDMVLETCGRVLETCGRVLILDGGGLAADGPAAEILRDRELLEQHHLELPFCLAGV